MKHSELLEIALDKHLAQPASDTGVKTRFICLALARVVNELPFQAIANKNEIVDYIKTSLYPAHTVTHWLMLNNYIRGHPNEFEREQVQLYRKRWMLHLIEEYKKQGK